VSRYRSPLRGLLWAHGLVWALGVAFGLLAVAQLRATTGQLDAVVTGHAERVIAVERIRAESERVGRSARGYLLTGAGRYLEELSRARTALQQQERALERSAAGGALAPRLAQLRALSARHQAALLAVVEARGRGEDPALLARLRQERAQPLRDRLDAELAQLAQDEAAGFQQAHHDARDALSRAWRWLGALAALSLLVSLVLTALLVRTLALLRRSRVELEERNRDLDAFAGRVAHDIRNLLSPLALQARVLRTRTGDAQAVEESAGRLERLARRADSLTGALLAFARASAPDAGPPRAAVRSAVADALEDLAPQRAALEGLQVHVELEDVGAACPPALLHTVLVNLVGNALKFLEGQPCRELWLRARAVDAGRCELVVEDSGPGIPAEAQRQLFAPFYRAPGTRAPGTGLGLATVRRILDAYGGDIHVRSAPGAGSAFTVRLPLAPPGAPPDPFPG
jgi:signal transduction histidine kinase